MSSKQSKEMASPVKKKFVSPINHSKRNAKSGISPKFRANLKAEFGKSLHQLSKGEQGLGHGKHPFPQHQRRKTQEKRRTSQIRYHMGGTIADPLNLNSLINRDPACVTPQASPMHHGESPVPIVEPQDSTDPLNLKCIPTSGKEVLVTPSKKKKKKKHRMSHTDEENIIETSGEKEDQNSPKEKKNKRKRKRSRSRSGGEKVEEESNKPSIDTDTNEPCVKECTELQNDSSIEKSISSDKESESELAAKKAKEENVKTEQTMIVSSVPQDSSVSCDKQNTKTVRGSLSHPNHRRKEKLFIYGNYTRYYGKRNPNHMEDSRLKCFKKEWFADKDVLDIGCNVGHVTLSIARDFKPRYIIGNDIDSSLIRAARNNIRFYIQTPVSGWTREGIEFPISFALVSGPLAAPVVAEEEAKPVFPHNVIFKQENYVLTCEAALKKQLPMYDTILCLSVTKWVHLNWGDEGIKLMFKRIFCNLRPGGVLILEPQPFSSYKKRKNLTEKICANYNRIKLRPEKFIDYLLSDEVGFAAYEVLEQQQAKFQGFQRPLYLLTKSTQS